MTPFVLAQQINNVNPQWSTYFGMMILRSSCSR